MSWLAALGALLPIIDKLLSIFMRTPEQKLVDIKKALLDFLTDLSEGIKHEKENPGDTSGIEHAINKRR